MTAATPGPTDGAARFDPEPALAWLLRSGIQETSGPDAGGVHAWIDERTGTPAYLYTEITGYFVTLCVKLHAAGLGDVWIDRARAASNWLVTRAQHASGGLFARKHASAADEAADEFSFARGDSPFFDNAMCGFGLLALHHVDGDARWLDAARRIGGFCERAFLATPTKPGPSAIAPPGFDHAAVNLRTGRPVPPGPRWSRHFGPFEAKGALFLDALAAADPKDGTWANRRDQMLTWAMESQRQDGGFPTEPTGATTHVHPHSYVLEGLAGIAIRQSRRDLVLPLARGVRWSLATCLHLERPVQQWSAHPEKMIPGLRSDIVFQSLRAHSLLRRLDLETTENIAPDPRIEAYLSRSLPSGGTAYGEDELGSRALHANAWCHFFRLDAVLERGDLGQNAAHSSNFLLV
jgi:hypothetical protein